jgi:hypothetical protein
MEAGNQWRQGNERITSLPVQLPDGSTGIDLGGPAVIAAIAIGGVIWLAMVGASGYGWVTLPADARVPVHFGAAAYNNFVPKRIGLILHPAVGALVYVLILVANATHTTHGPSLPVDVILPLLMCLLLVVQAGAIRAARRRSGP